MDYLNNIIYIGLSGPAGSGKTVTANLLAPGGVLPLDHPITTVYQHHTLAAPIHEIVGIKRNTKGADSQSRIMYQLHDVLNDVIGASVDYDTLIETVYDFYAADAGESSDPKPRSFMQWVGDVCRSYDKDCFVDNLLRRSRRDYLQTQRDMMEVGLDSDPLMLVFVSDVRRINEFEKLRAQPKSVLVRFEASREVLSQRMLERDGLVMTPEQWNHPTEAEANDIDPSYFDIVIDTSDITIKDQASAVNSFLIGYLGISLINSIEKVKITRSIR